MRSDFKPSHSNPFIGGVWKWHILLHASVATHLQMLKEGCLFCRGCVCFRMVHASETSFMYTAMLAALLISERGRPYSENLYDHELHATTHSAVSPLMLHFPALR